jgi:hypothetical protein
MEFHWDSNASSIQWELMLFIAVGMAIGSYALNLLLGSGRSGQARKSGIRHWGAPFGDASNQVSQLDCGPQPQGWPTVLKQAQANREKRAAPRRDGNPMPVLVRPKPASPEASEGTVLNRSRGGLLLSLAEPAPLGAAFLLRTSNMPDDLAWIEVEARNVRPKEDGYLVGCAFKHELPWGLLLFFG